jgi:hypothetical protein
MYGTTQDFAQVQARLGSDYGALEKRAGETQRQHARRRKPPARYEAIAIAIMLLIVAVMPLFSR